MNTRQALSSVTPELRKTISPLSLSMDTENELAPHFTFEYQYSLPHLQFHQRIAKYFLQKPARQIWACHFPLFLEQAYSVPLSIYFLRTEITFQDATNQPKFFEHFFRLIRSLFFRSAVSANLRSTQKQIHALVHIKLKTSRMFQVRTSSPAYFASKDVFAAR